MPLEPPQGNWISPSVESKLRIIVTVFIVLHGLVHLLYVGQSQSLFELQAGMTWPDGSWAFSRLLGDEGTRLLASACCLLAAIGFVAGGIGLLARQAWWRPMIVGAAAFSAAMLLVLWDGQMQRLDDQGGIAVLINLAILALLLVLRWPDFGF
jgi:hypothetical protein